jgi:hypothetical protein
MDDDYQQLPARPLSWLVMGWLYSALAVFAFGAVGYLVLVQHSGLNFTVLAGAVLATIAATGNWIAYSHDRQLQAVRR